ncbi:MAG: hypothetical protein L7S67_04130 [Flavobacteriales bacterium]|nr:hypothetical protein [Flavobacteriales bacterium]
MSIKGFFCVFLMATGVFLADARAQVDGDIDAQQVLKLNLSDWYFARYELCYEHVLNESTSVQIALAGIGASEESERYFFNNLTMMDSWANVEVNHSGWRFTPELRRYAWVYGGMPEGVFVSIMGRIENWNLEFDEDIDDFDGIPEGQFEDELDGNWNQFHWGGGVLVGYQWYSDNGISLEVYTGPMFRSYSRTWKHDGTLNGEEQELAEDSVEDRLFSSSRWYTYLNSDSGPGWRFGLTVGLGL